MAEDCVITVRLRVKTLANVASFLNLNHVLPRGRSGLIRLGLEVLEDSIIAQGAIVPVRSTEKALEILEVLGFPIEKMVTQQIRRNLAEETIMNDFDGVELEWEDSSAIAAIPSLSEIKNSLIIEDEEE